MDSPEPGVLGDTTEYTFTKDGNGKRVAGPETVLAEEFKYKTAALPGKDFRAIDLFAIRDGKPAQEPVKGIYRIKDETLTLVIPQTGNQERPTSFDPTKQGGSHLTLKRQKP